MSLELILCRGFKGRNEMLMARIKAELEMKIAEYLNIDLLRLRR